MQIHQIIAQDCFCRAFVCALQLTGCAEQQIAPSGGLRDGRGNARLGARGSAAAAELRRAYQPAAANIEDWIPPCQLQ